MTPPEATTGAAEAPTSRPRTKPAWARAPWLKRTGSLKAAVILIFSVVAVCLLAAFYLLLRAQTRTEGSDSRIALGLSGLAAGYASITSYPAAVCVLFFAAYLWFRGDRRDRWLWFGLGLVGPFLLITFYNQVCFGTPFTTNYHFQNPDFRGGSTIFLGVLELPRLDRLAKLLFSPFRGLFVSSPVLLVGVLGLLHICRSRERRAEGLLIGAIVAFFLLFNISFNGWHGLALPVTYGFIRFFRTTAALAIVSVLVMGLLTVVDPQPPVGIASIASFPGRATWLRSPLTEYALPLLVSGRAAPILEAQVEDLMRKAEEDLVADEIPEDEREHRLAEYRERLEGSRPLANFVGPVSANPIGMYEGSLGHLFKPPAEELRWNSFNAGELLLPRSRLSLLFLLLLAGPLVVSALALARRRCLGWMSPCGWPRRSWRACGSSRARRPRLPSRPHRTTRFPRFRRGAC